MKRLREQWELPAATAHAAPVCEPRSTIAVLSYTIAPDKRAT